MRGNYSFNQSHLATSVLLSTYCNLSTLWSTIAAEWLLPGGRNITINHLSPPARSAGNAADQLKPHNYQHYTQSEQVFGPFPAHAANHTCADIIIRPHFRFRRDSSVHIVGTCI